MPRNRPPSKSSQLGRHTVFDFNSGVSENLVVYLLHLILKNSELCNTFESQVCGLLCDTDQALLMSLSPPFCVAHRPGSVYVSASRRASSSQCQGEYFEGRDSPLAWPQQKNLETDCHHKLKFHDTNKKMDIIAILGESKKKICLKIWSNVWLFSGQPNPVSHCHHEMCL